MNDRLFDTLSEFVAFIAFRQTLLFWNDTPSRFVFEMQLTGDEYYNILALLDDYRDKISRGEKVQSADFEEQVRKIAPITEQNSRFCEVLTHAFYTEKKWEEVFETLYGHMPQYR